VRRRRGDAGGDPSGGGSPEIRDLASPATIRDRIWSGRERETRGTDLGGREGEAAAVGSGRWRGAAVSFGARRASTGGAGKRERKGGRASSPPHGAPEAVVRRRAAAGRRGGSGTAARRRARARVAMAARALGFCARRRLRRGGNEARGVQRLNRSGRRRLGMRARGGDGEGRAGLEPESGAAWGRGRPTGGARVLGRERGGGGGAGALIGRGTRGRPRKRKENGGEERGGVRAAGGLTEQRHIFGAVFLKVSPLSLPRQILVPKGNTLSRNLVCWLGFYPRGLRGMYR
jgi:hypothetical protein